MGALDPFKVDLPIYLSSKKLIIKNPPSLHPKRENFIDYSDLFTFVLEAVETGYMHKNPTQKENSQGGSASKRIYGREREL